MAHLPSKPVFTTGNEWLLNKFLEEVQRYAEREGTVKAVSASYVVQNEYLIVADSTGGVLTITLPTAVNNHGRKVVVKHSAGASNITISAQSSDNIDGAASVTLNSATNSVMLVSDGYTTWYRIKLP